jgi:hypothetical protein
MSSPLARHPLPPEAGPDPAAGEVEVTVVMPCLNEAQTLATCIRKAQNCLREHGIRSEIVIADNGSTDGSQQIARDLGARVADVPEKGYGSALRGGIAAARGAYIIMGDADDSYDFTSLMPFIEALRGGSDLVMGNRFRGGIRPGAMPPLHRYLGNPVLTGIGRLFFRSPVGDFHCGMRGFRREAILSLNLQTTGMEFASEMVVKASLLGLEITEVPTTLSPDGRNRPPHLRSWRDGWRHLRFMLLYSPRWLFLYPGIVLVLVGLTVGGWLMPGPRQVSGVTLDIHTLLYAALAVLLGFQAIVFAVSTKAFASATGLAPPDHRIERLFQVVSLEICLIIGGVLVLLGIGGSLYAVHVWSFRPLSPSHGLRLIIPSVIALALGFQTIFSMFFLNAIGLRRR